MTNITAAAARRLPPGPTYGWPQCHAVAQSLLTHLPDVDTGPREAMGGRPVRLIPGVIFELDATGIARNG